MRKIWSKFPIWMCAGALIFTLMFQIAGPVYAGEPATDPGSGDLQVTGYKVMKGAPSDVNAASAYAGKIQKGDEVTIKVDIYDSRAVPDGSPVAVVLNTSSFTIPALPKLSDGTITDVQAGAYSIIFKKLKYTGTGNTLEFNVSYPGSTLPMQPVSITLNQCTPPKDDAGSNIVTKGTGFVLKDARYGEGTVYAGQQFTLSAVILATNGEAAVENVSVAFTPPEQITMADGASVVYIGTMSPGASASVSAVLMPGANIQEGSYPVSIDVSGVNQKTGDPVSASMTVTIPVLQPERFEIFDAMLPTDLTAGVDDGLGYTTVTLVNMGRGSVANVTAEIVGEGLYAEEGKQYLGNVGAGEQKVAEFVLHADTPGMIDAQVLITYENERGDQKSLERDFSVNVMEAMIDKPGMGPDIGYPPDGGVGAQGPGIFQQLWFWIVVVVAAAVIVTVLLLRRRRKRIAAAEAALDYSEDDD